MGGYARAIAKPLGSPKRGQYAPYRLADSDSVDKNQSTNIIAVNARKNVFNIKRIISQAIFIFPSPLFPRAIFEIRAIP
jgi:hypothetical protein